MAIVRKILIVLLIALIVIQFFRPKKNKAAAIPSTDITKQYAVPKNVTNIIQTACYNCHSNNTEYPWYYHIQPVAWWMAGHINEGKEHLNFSEFASYSTDKAAKKLDHVNHMVSKGKMPLQSYQWEHPEARLSPTQVKLVADWAENLSKQIKNGTATSSAR